MDDAQLLALFVADRSESAFAELVRRHVGFVYRVALRRVAGDSHLAEDVTQTVFIALARDARKLRDQRLLIAWLHGATKFAAAHAVRTEQRRRYREEEAMKMHPPDDLRPPDPETAVAPVLDQAIDSLNERDRQALLLRFFERAPFAEIGHRMQLSEDAARMRVDRALERLRLWLAQRGVTSTAAAIGTVLSAEAGLAAPLELAGTVTAAAINGTAASVGTGALILGFMNTTKIAAITAGLAIFATGTAIHERQATLGARLALERTTRDLTTTQIEYQRLRRSLNALAQPLSIPSGLPPDPAGSQLAATTGPNTTTTVSLSDEDRMAQMAAKNPELLNLLIRVQTLQTTPEFGGFERQLGMSEEKAHTFEQILNDSWSEWAKNQVERVRQGLKQEDPEATALTNPIIERRYARLAEFLGPADYAALRRYEAAADQRAMAKELAGALSFTTPLSADQTDKLVQAFAPGDSPEAATDWNRAMLTAEAFLSPPQIAELGNYRAYRETQAAITKFLAQATDAK